MNIKIYTTDKQDASFYAVMGEHFASLEHKKELDGWQLYNKHDSVWFLLYDEEVLKGFCAIFKKKDYYYLDNFMILREYRGQKLSVKLMSYCLSYFTDNKIRTMTKNLIQMKLFEKFNFIKYNSKGSYNLYERS